MEIIVSTFKESGKWIETFFVKDAPSSVYIYDNPEIQNYLEKNYEKLKNCNYTFEIETTQQYNKHLVINNKN